MLIQEAEYRDLPMIVELACCLWQEHTPEEMHTEMEQIIRKPDVRFFLAATEDGAVGFAQCQLRHDYVEGTDGSPVGFLEGIYVRREYRNRGVARALLAACETWAKSRGCTAFASDCELTNRESLAFHLNVGFEEANRIICFVKSI